MGYVLMFEEERLCEYCEAEYVTKTQTQLFCSKECKQQNQYDKNKNPYSITNLTEHRFTEVPNSYGEYYVDPEILRQAELYSDCAVDANFGYTSEIQEDSDDLHMILRSEYSYQKARYEKRHNAKYSGRNYWEAKLLRNYHRKKVGVPELPTIRYHSFERQLNEHHEQKQGKKLKKSAPSEAELQTPGFTTITPMKTRSGRLTSEILDNVKRKKSVGST